MNTYNSIYYILFFSYRFIITMRLPIITLFLISQNYNLITIGFGYSVLSLTSIISNIPIGYFADIFGKKTTYIFLLIIESLSAVLFIFSEHIACFYLSFFLLGLSTSSVAILQSWYVNIYHAYKPCFPLSNVFKNIQILSNIATFLGIIISAIIAQFFSYKMAFFSIFLFLFLFSISCSISLKKDYFLSSKENKNIKFREFLKIFKNSRILSVLIFSSTLGFIYSGYAVIWSPIFNKIIGEGTKNSLVKSSFIYSLLYLVSGIILIYTNKILLISKKSQIFKLYVIRIIFGISFILMGFYTQSPFIFAVVTLIMFIVGYMEYAPLQEVYNHFLPDKFRTVGLSISTTFEGILSSFGGFTIALIYNKFETQKTLYFIGIIGIISVIPIQFTFFKFKNSMLLFSKRSNPRS